MCDKALMKWSDETMDKATAYHDLHKGVDDWFHQNGTTAVVRARFPDGNGNWVVTAIPVAPTVARGVGMKAPSCLPSNTEMPLDQPLSS